MDRVFLFILVVSLHCVYGTIEIKKLTGPNSIEYTGDDTEDIVLDCDFEAIGEKFSELEIFWYHNGDSAIYQWIPATKKPGEARGIFRNHLDSNYTVSDNNATMYRALKLTNVNTNLTGNYTCKVSSLQNEDEATKQLIVYSSAKDGMEITLSEEEQNVKCTVQGVFPEPNIDIYILSGENRTKTDLEEITISQEDDSGLYNVTTRHHFIKSNFSTSSVTFVCDLNIPGTNYNLSESLDYNTGSKSTIIHSTAALYLPALLILLIGMNE